MKMNWPFLLVAKGYKGHIGCEYLPRGQTEDGLQWLDEVMEWSLKSPKAKAEKSWQIEVAIPLPFGGALCGMGQPHMAKSVARGKPMTPRSSWTVRTSQVLGRLWQLPRVPGLLVELVSLDPFEEAKQRMGEPICVWVYGYRTFESGGFVRPLWVLGVWNPTGFFLEAS